MSHRGGGGSEKSVTYYLNDPLDLWKFLRPLSHKTRSEKKKLQKISWFQVYIFVFYFFFLVRIYTQNIKVFGQGIQYLFGIKEFNL